MAEEKKVENQEAVVEKAPKAKKAPAKKATATTKSTTATKTTKTAAKTTKTTASKTTKAATAKKETVSAKAEPVTIPVKFVTPKKDHAFLEKKYKTEIAPALMAKYNYRSVMEIPHLEKIVVNMGVGDATTNSKLIEAAVEDLKTITGQKPVVTKAKKSIAVFKVREGQEIGCKVTLRGDRMYEFLNKLVNIALPRVRDFHGVSAKAFDGRGNYTLGIKEQLIFPEINYDKVVKVRGMDIVIVTTAKTDEEGKELLKLFGMPFEK